MNTDRFTDDELRSLLRTVVGTLRQVLPDDKALNRDIKAALIRRHEWESHGDER